MSKQIEERIAKLTFDNKQFQQAISESSSSLSTLDSDLSKAGKNKDISKIGDNVQGISEKFSALSIIATGALLEIGRQAVQTGQKLASALIMDPITDGFTEYELKIDSVKNILNSAKGTDGLPVTLAEVNKQLEELNKYSDQTIYSFSDMTKNIGKFTNAGVDLEKSVQSIKGISNVAALYGADANQASAAMYNFAQALSSGSVKLIDWKSIENANMASVEFKEHLLDAAVAAGTVEAAGEGMYKVLSTNGQGKRMDGVMNATQMFNDSLQYQWMTTEVLTDTLSDYADETTGIGAKATEAATKVRTLTQLTDTLKEALGSGWATSWELIFGDYDEATKVFTQLNDYFGNLIDISSKSRNKLIKDWSDLGGRTDLIEGVKAGWNGLLTIMAPIRDAFQSVFPPATAETLANLSKGFRSLMEGIAIGPETADKLRIAFEGLFSVIHLGWEVGKVIFNALRAIITAILPSGDGLLSLAAAIGSFFTTLNNSAKEGNVFAKVSENLAYTFTTIIEKIKDFVAVIADSAALQTAIKILIAPFYLLGDAIKYLGELLVNGVDFEKTAEHFTGIFTKMGSALGTVAKPFKTATTAISGTFTKFRDQFYSLDFSNIDKNMLASMDVLCGGIENAEEKLRDPSSGISKHLASIGMSASDLPRKFDGFGSILEKIKNFFSPVIEFLKPIGKFFSDLFSNIKTMVGDTFKTDGFEGVLDLIKILAAGGIAAGVYAFIDAIKTIHEIVDPFTEAFSNILGSFDDAIKKMTQVAVMDKIAKSILILTISLIALSMIEGPKLAAASFAIAALFFELSKSFNEMTKSAGSTPGKAISNVGTQILMLSIAVLLITVALGKMAKMDSAALGVATITLGAVFTMIAGFLKVLPKDTSAIKNVAESLLQISKAVLILALAVALMSIIPVDRMFAASQALAMIVSVLTTLLVLLSKLVADTGKLDTVTKAMSTLGSTLLKFALAILIVGLLPVERMDGVSRVFSILLAELAVFITAMSKLVSKPEAIITIASAMNKMALAMIIMSLAMAILGTMNADTLTKASVTLGVILAEVAGFAISISKLSGDMASLTTIGNVIMKMALGLVVMAMVVKILGSVPSSELAAGLGALALILVEFGAFAAVMGLALQGVDMKTIASALNSLVGAVLVLAIVVALFSAIGWDSIGPAIGAMALLLLEFGAFAALMATLVDGGKLMAIATAMTTLAGAIVILSIGMLLLGMLDWDSLLVGLTAIAGIFVILGAAGLLLGPVAPIITSLAASIMTLSLAVLTIAAASALFAAALLLLAVSGMPGVAVIIAAITSLLMLLPLAAEKFAEGIVGFIMVIAGAIPQLVGVIGDLITEIVTMLGIKIPIVMALVIDAIYQLMVAIDERLPEIMQKGVDILVTLLNGILSVLGILVEAAVLAVAIICQALADRMPELLESGWNLLKAFSEGFQKYFPLLLDEGCKLFIAFLYGLGDALKENIPLVLDAVGYICVSILEGFASFFGISTREAKEGENIAVSIILGIIKGFIDFVAKIGKVVLDVCVAIWDAFVKFFDIHSPSKKMDGLGGNIMMGLIQGIFSFVGNLLKTVGEFLWEMIKTIGDTIRDFSEAGGDLIWALIKGIGIGIIELPKNIMHMIKEAIAVLKDGVWDFMSIGGDLIDGLLDGLFGGVGKLIGGIKNIADKAIGGIKGFFGIHSPSKVFMEVGQYCDEGLAVGINKYSNLVEKEAKNMGEDTVSTMSKVMHDLASAVEDDLEADPKITPVLDLSNVEKGAKTLSGMLSGGRSLDVSASISKATLEKASIQNGSDLGTDQSTTITNNFDLSNLTVRQESDIDTIAEKLYQKQQQALRGAGVRTAFW